MDEHRLKSLLFHDESMRNIYPRYDVKHYKKESPQALTKCEKKSRAVQPYQPKDIQTLSGYTEKPVRFDLFIKKRPILREQPLVLVKPFTKPVDEDLEKVIATRPRLVLPSAYSLDDIQDREVRDLIIKDAFMSTKEKDYVVTVEKNLESPLPTLLNTHKQISLPDLTPIVPLEWREESLAFDDGQNRYYADCSEEFWLNSYRQHRNRSQ